MVNCFWPSGQQAKCFWSRSETRVWWTLWRVAHWVFNENFSLSSLTWTLTELSQRENIGSFFAAHHRPSPAFTRLAQIEELRCNKDLPIPISDSQPINRLLTTVIKLVFLRSWNQIECRRASECRTDWPSASGIPSLSQLCGNCVGSL